MSVSDAVTNIAAAALTTDLTAYTNKVAAATAFTAALDTGAEVLAYTGADANAAAKAWLSAVTTDASLVAQKATLDATVAAIVVATPAANAGQTFTLTTGVDYADTTSAFKNGGLLTTDFKFTAGNEIVTAGAFTLGDTDALIDGSTVDADVLNATLTSGASVTPTIQNIETLNLTSIVADSGLNFAKVLGAKTVTLTGTADAQLTNINSNAAPTISINNYTKVATVTAATLLGTAAAGTADSLTINVSGLTAGGTTAAPVIPGLILNATAAGVLETLNLASAGTTKNTVALTLGANVTSLAKTVVTGAADLDLNLIHAAINGQTLDASAHTAALNLSVDRSGATTAVTNLTNVTGVDTYTFIAGTGNALVASGIASGSTVVATYATTGASSIAVKGAAAGTADSLTVRIDNAKDATDTAIATSLTIADVETVKLVSEGGTTTGNSIKALTVNAGSAVTLEGSTKMDLELAGASAVTTITVSGSGAHKVDFANAVTYAEAKNLTIDGSTATGKLTLDGSDFSGTTGGVIETLTIKGGTTDDTITGTANANAKNVIDAGAGADIVNLATVNNSNVTLGAGADKLNITGVTGAGSVTVTDFALGTGGDVLSVTTGSVATFAGVAANASIGVLTILNASQANDAAIATKINAIADGAGKASVIVLNDATGVAELWYDANTSDDDSAIVKLASFENITTVGILTDAVAGFTAANFGDWA